MSLKDTWKNKTDGVDDVLAEDINSIAGAVIKLEEENEVDKAPYIGDNGNWFEWNDIQQGYVDTGVKANGEDGYTPQKGVDYFTAEDIEGLGIDNKANKEDLQAEKERINKLKYYGDPDIIISPEEWFTFANDEHTILTGFSEGHKDETNIVIPYSVTSISDSVFSGCSNLTSITIPDSVTSIDFAVFSGCSSLTSITIPDGVTSISASTFSGCSSLTSITIPDSVIYIGSKAFYNCSSLTSVTIPDSVIYISDAVFKRSDNVTIYCSQGSYAETYAKENNIPVKYTDGYTPRSSTALPEMLDVNTIYDLGEQDALTLNLPSGKLGDFIEVDFLSTQTPTTLTITASTGMSDYELIPDANTIYSLYFNWIRLDVETYGWGFGYAEYTRTVTE